MCRWCSESLLHAAKRQPRTTTAVVFAVTIHLSSPTIMTGTSDRCRAPRPNPLDGRWVVGVARRSAIAFSHGDLPRSKVFLHRRKVAGRHLPSIGIVVFEPGANLDVRLLDLDEDCFPRRLPVAAGKRAERP